MKKLDPRVMLLIAACFSTLGVIIEKTWLLTIVFIVCALFVSAMGVHLIPIIRKLKGFITIIIFVAFLQSIFQPEGTTILKIGAVNILTTGGLLKGANTLLRLAVVIVSASLFTLTTSRRMMQGLIQMKVPYEFAFMTSIAIRFLPIFSEEFRDTLTAIQLRGVEIKKIPIREKVKVFTYILMPVVYGSIEKAQKLSYSIELRAFRAFSKRTSRFTLSLCAADYIYIVIVPIITAAVLYCYFIY